MRRFLLIIIFLISNYFIFAQDKVDSAYINSYPQQIVTRLYMSQKYVALNNQNQKDNRFSSYLPNSTLNLGIGATLSGFTLNLAYGFKFLNNHKDRGETKYLDLQSHLYTRKYVIDFFGENYRGFYLREKGSPNVVRPDMAIYQYGLFGQYLFNNKKFSYRAAFIQDEWQKKTSGSFLAGAAIYYNYIKGDSSVLTNRISQTKQVIQNFQIGPNVGYGYTVVIKRHFFITGSLSVGLNIGVGTVSDQNGESTNVFIQPNLFPRFSAGYNSDKWALNLMYVDNRIHIGYMDNTNINTNTGNYRLIFSRRFDFQWKKKKGPVLQKLFPDK